MNAWLRPAAPLACPWVATGAASAATCELVAAHRFLCRGVKNATRLAPANYRPCTRVCVTFHRFIRWAYRIRHAVAANLLHQRIVRPELSACGPGQSGRVCGPSPNSDKQEYDGPGDRNRHLAHIDLPSVQTNACLAQSRASHPRKVNFYQALPALKVIAVT
jgi:hypothetical protein